MFACLSYSCCAADSNNSYGCNRCIYWHQNSSEFQQQKEQDGDLLFAIGSLHWQASLQFILQCWHSSLGKEWVCTAMFPWQLTWAGCQRNVYVLPRIHGSWIDALCLIRLTGDILVVMSVVKAIFLEPDCVLVPRIYELQIFSANTWPEKPQQWVSRDAQDGLRQGRWAFLHAGAIWSRLHCWQIPGWRHKALSLHFHLYYMYRTSHRISQNLQYCSFPIYLIPLFPIYSRLFLDMQTALNMKSGSLAESNITTSFCLQGLLQAQSINSCIGKPKSLCVILKLCRGQWLAWQCAEAFKACWKSWSTICGSTSCAGSWTTATPSPQSWRWQHLSLAMSSSMARLSI